MAKRTIAKSASGKSNTKSARPSPASATSPKTVAVKSVKTAKRPSGSAAPATNKKTARKKIEPAEKLHTVTPSGKKDQPFFELVFEVARQIPKGRVTSYGAIAASLGAKSSSRMVGWAMNLAGNAKPKVPAHRVVNRNGMLSGKHHFGTPTRMQELLEKEGIKVKHDKVVDFNKLFWDPMDLGD